MLWLTLNGPFTCLMLYWFAPNNFQPYKRQCIKQESNQSIKQEVGFHSCPHMVGLASIKIIVKLKDPVCIAWKALY